ELGPGDDGGQAPGEWMGLPDRNEKRPGAVLLQIGPADPAGAHLDDHLAGAGRAGLRHLLDPDVVARVPEGGFHAYLPGSARSGRVVAQASPCLVKPRLRSAEMYRRGTCATIAHGALYLRARLATTPLAQSPSDSVGQHRRSS